MKPLRLSRTCATLALLLFPLHLAWAGSATWNATPVNSNWNLARNWTPTTVPNNPGDVATFGVSSTTLVTLSADTEVGSIAFMPGAGAFTITQAHVFDPFTLTISGTGVVNNSGTTQSFLSARDNSGQPGAIIFTNAATAGDDTSYTVAGGALMDFFDSASAGTGFFSNNGGEVRSTSGGVFTFHDNATVAGATVITNGGSADSAGGALTQLLDTASAGEGTFVVNGGAASAAGGGALDFLGDTTAAEGAFSINGATAMEAGGGTMRFLFDATAGSGTITVNGSSGSGLAAGLLQFLYSAKADAAMLVANGGSGGGGSIQFGATSDGGTAQVMVSGNGNLDISLHDAPGVTVGSLEGNGMVFLGGRLLTIGSAGESTTFSGTIQDAGVGGGTGGGIVKIDRGTLSLNGANTYTGETVLTGGIISVGNSAGSATGFGPVSVNGGILEGNGIIAGAVIVGSGGNGPRASLSPSNEATAPETLTCQQSLIFASHGIYGVLLKIKGGSLRSDKIVANGVSILSGATISFRGRGQSSLAPGTTVTLIDNTSETPIDGVFSNLRDGAIVTVGSNNFAASYEGGDGNDLTLTVVP